MVLTDCRLFRLHDWDAERRTSEGAQEIDPAHASEWNAQGYGIHRLVNDFNGPRRKENLKKIRAWYCDIDDGTKFAQWQRIKALPIIPSEVIETARGYHCYWYAADATVANFSEVQDRLLLALNGDERAADLARILRAPGYFHAKDPKSPFLVQARHFTGDIHEERVMLYMFPAPKPEVVQETLAKRELMANLAGAGDENLWARIWRLDQMEALKILSGTAAVNGEKYTFKRVSRGNYNIFVNKKTTSCFIDKDKRIGSMSAGGPSIANWLFWYHRDWKKVVALLKQYLPELFPGEGNSWSQQNSRSSPITAKIVLPGPADSAP